MSQEKAYTYAALLIEGIMELVDEHGWQDDFEDSENLTQFVHALANIAPNMITNELTGQDNDILRFNHLANGLVFQFSKMKDNEA